MIKLRKILPEFAGKVHDLETLELKLIGMVKNRKLDHPEASNILTHAYEEAKTKGVKIAVQNALKDAQKGMREDLSIEKKLSRYAGRYGGEPEKLVPDPGEQNADNPVVQSSSKGGSNKSKKRGKFAGTYSEGTYISELRKPRKGERIRTPKGKGKVQAVSLPPFGPATILVSWDWDVSGTPSPRVQAYPDEVKWNDKKKEWVVESVINEARKVPEGRLFVASYITGNGKYNAYMTKDKGVQIGKGKFYLDLYDENTGKKVESREFPNQREMMNYWKEIKKNNRKMREHKLKVEHIQYLAEGFMVRVARTRNRKLANQLVFMLRRNIGLRSLAGKDFKVRKIGAGKYGVYAMKPLVQQSREWLKKNAERLPQKYKVEQTSKSDKTPRGGQGYRTGQEYWASKRGDVQRAQSDVEKFQSKTRKPKPIREDADEIARKLAAAKSAYKKFDSRSQTRFDWKYKTRLRDRIRQLEKALRDVRGSK